MLTEEQIEQRRTLVTASDVAAICGLSPYATAHDVYAAKIAGTRSEDDYRIKRGRYLEPLGVELLGAKLSPYAVKATGELTRTHATFTWLGATPDALVYQADTAVAVGEIKAVGPNMTHAWDDDAGDAIVPDYVLCQAQVQMTVCRLKKAHIVAMLDAETEPRFYEADHDPEAELAIIEVCDDFRRKHLVPRIPPPLDGSPAATRMIKALYPRPMLAVYDPTTPTERAEIDALAKEFMAARAAGKSADKRKEAAQTAICARIGEHDAVYGTGWRAFWRMRSGYEVPAYTVEAGRVFDLREIGAKSATGKAPRKRSAA